MAKNPHAPKKKVTKSKRQPVQATIVRHITKSRKLDSVRQVWRPKKRPTQNIPARPLPNPFRFTTEVFSVLWRERKLFGKLFILVTVAALLLFGATQQDQYVATTDALKEYKKSATAPGGISDTVGFGLLLTTAATGGLNSTLSETQQVYLLLFYALIWLTTIWLLRHRLAGMPVVIRDGLYNAAGPAVTIIALFFVGVLQMLPMALGVVVYSSAVTSGVLNGPVETGAFAVGALLLTALSLYWVTSTFFAVIIATNPGTYPVVALKVANEIVAGRRLKLMLRILWLIVLLVLLWAIVLIPAVLIDSLISQAFIPVVVLSLQLLTSFSVIFAPAYLYLLYRKMIDDESAS